MDDDFDAKRTLIEALDVQMTLVVEDDDQIAYARCLLNGDDFLTSDTIQGIVPKLWHRLLATRKPKIYLPPAIAC